MKLQNFGPKKDKHSYTGALAPQSSFYTPLLGRQPINYVESFSKVRDIKWLHLLILFTFPVKHAFGYSVGTYLHLYMYMYVFMCENVHACARYWACVSCACRGPRKTLGVILRCTLCFVLLWVLETGHLIGMGLLIRLGWP